MNAETLLAEQFEENRPHLRAVAYRMLGSLDDSEDAVQETWLRLYRSDAGAIENLQAWLTRVIARVCLDVLRSRRLRREQALGVHVPDPLVSSEDECNPEYVALLGDSVGLAMLVVLDTLAPAERGAFVLHDVFSMPFEEIAAVVGRTATAARQLASRARRRLQGTPQVPDPDLAQQQKAVAAFFAAARVGDFDALVSVLDPDVVLRSDGGPLRSQTVVLRGAETVAKQALMFAKWSPFVRPALVNGAAGVVVAPGGRTANIMGFTVVGGTIAAIDVLADPQRLRDLERSWWHRAGSP